MTRAKIKPIFAAFLLGLVSAFSLGETLAQAREIPRAPDTYVYDETAKLAPETRARLASELARFYETTSQQIVVAVFRSLEGEEVSDFTNRVFQAWKIGQQQKDNGALLAIYLDDRKLRIEAGYGLEPVLTDARSKRIIEAVIKPELKNGDLDRAVILGARAIVETIKNPDAAPAAAPKRRVRVLNGTPLMIFYWVLLFLFIRWLSGTQQGTHIGGVRRGRSSGSGWSSGGGGFGGGGFGGSSGGGGWSGGGGGGGFSGGGGRSGGGGASGSW